MQDHCHQQLTQLPHLLHGVGPFCTGPHPGYGPGQKVVIRICSVLRGCWRLWADITHCKGQSSCSQIWDWLQWEDLSQQSHVYNLFYFWCSVVASPDSCSQVFQAQTHLMVTICLQGIVNWWYPVGWLLNLCNYAHGDSFVKFLFTSGLMVMEHFMVSEWCNRHHHAGWPCIHQESVVCLQTCLDTHQSTCGYLKSCPYLGHDVPLGLFWVVTCGCCLSYVCLWSWCVGDVSLA